MDCFPRYILNPCNYGSVNLESINQILIGYLPGTTVLLRSEPLLYWFVLQEKMLPLKHLFRHTKFKKNKFPGKHNRLSTCLIL